MNDKFLSLLGMARRAGKLSLGHDAATAAIVRNSAKLCVISSEGSDRLKREMEHSCSYEGKNIPLLITDYTITELSAAIGSKAAVLTVDDEGFASALNDRYTDRKE